MSLMVIIAAWPITRAYELRENAQAAGDCAQAVLMALGVPLLPS